MASNSSSAYDLTLFNAIPLPERRVEQPPVPVIVEPRASKSKAQLRRESVGAFANAVRVIAAATVLLMLFAGIIGSRVKLSMAQHESQQLKNELSIVQSENVRLNMQLNSMISDDMVEDYAENVLGLKKIEKYQIHYFESNGKDSAFVFKNKR
ncbi:MAG: hypothetical protein IKH13_06535 [Clostridia bacterium]|nr:hypothetical protein [Clostridia bacterium]